MKGYTNKDKSLNQIIPIILEYDPKILAAIAVFVIGTWIIKTIISIFSKMMDRSGVDSSLKPFVKGLINGLLKVMLIISVLGMLGVKMTSFMLF